MARVDLHGLTQDAEVFGSTISGRIAPQLGSTDDPTAAGRAFANVIMNLTGGERPFFREGYEGSYGFNFAVLVNAVGNAGPSNAAAQNVEPDRAGLRLFARFRALRQRAALRAQDTQASNDPRERRLFLFRNRY